MLTKLEEFSSLHLTEIETVMEGGGTGPRVSWPVSSKMRMETYSS